MHVLHVQHAGDIVAAVPARGASSLRHHQLYQRSRPAQPAGAPLGRQQTPGAVCGCAKGGAQCRQRGGHEVHAQRRGQARAVAGGAARVAKRPCSRPCLWFRAARVAERWREGAQRSGARIRAAVPSGAGNQRSVRGRAQKCSASVDGCRGQHSAPRGRPLRGVKGGGALRRGGCSWSVRGLLTPVAGARARSRA